MRMCWSFSWISWRLRHRRPPNYYPLSSSFSSSEFEGSNPPLGSIICILGCHNLLGILVACAQHLLLPCILFGLISFGHCLLLQF